MAIRVEALTKGERQITFRVEVKEKDTKTSHKVTMERDFYNKIGTSLSPEKVVEKSFEFLLEREPKESILSMFDIKAIANYFPEYEDFLRTL